MSRMRIVIAGFLYSVALALGTILILEGHQGTLSGSDLSRFRGRDNNKELIDTTCNKHNNIDTTCDGPEDVNQGCWTCLTGGIHKTFNQTEQAKVPAKDSLLQLVCDEMWDGICTQQGTSFVCDAKNYADSCKGVPKAGKQDTP